MKKAGILNRHLSSALAELGHGDGVLVCDAGMPIPDGPKVVDLAFRAGVPSFAEVLAGLLDELVVEGATEVREANPAAAALLEGEFPGPGPGPARPPEATVAGRTPGRPHRRGPAVRKRAAEVRSLLLEAG